MSRNHVEVEGLAFSYGELEIFRGLSLVIPEGKVVAILGGSGSGKSTLLKLIGGQLAPSRGRVKVAGKDVHKLSPDDLYALRLDMGMMFQTSGLFSDLSVFDNVAFPIVENFALPDEVARRMVLMKLHAVGLRGAKDMRPTDLSGGVTRRGALARGIAAEPRRVLDAGPLAGPDPDALPPGGPALR